MRIQTFRGCYRSQSHTSKVLLPNSNRSLEQRNLRGGPTALKREPIASARRE